MAGLIYYGNAEETAVLERAALFLNTSAEKLNSDIRFVRYRDKAVMDDIRQLLQRFSLKSEGFCIVFDKAGELNANCQNALLKALEDRDDILFIFICKGSRMLATVESRSTVEYVGAMSFEEFREAYPELPQALYYLTGGAVNEATAGDPKLLEISARAGENILSFVNNKKELLSMMGQLKEKDGDNFFVTHRDYVAGLYDMISQLLIERIEEDGVIEKLDEIERHKELLRRSNSYGVNDFFDLLISV